MKKLLLSDSDIMGLRHPQEDMNFLIMLIFYVPLLLLVFFLAFLSYEMFLILLLSIITLLRLAQGVIRAYLRANTLKVSNENFPDIYMIIKELRHTLGYNHKTVVFIADRQKLPLWAIRLVRKNCLVLDATLIEKSLIKKNMLQLKWMIARFIGGRKINMMRMDIFIWIYESILNIGLLNLLLLPYERINQLSADNIGLFICKDVNEVEKGFSQLMVGHQLAEYVRLPSLIAQGVAIRKTLWHQLGKIYASRPSILERYFNLLAFAKRFFPDQYLIYISRYQIEQRNDIRQLVAKAYANYASIDIDEIISATTDAENIEIQRKIRINRKP